MELVQAVAALIAAVATLISVVVVALRRASKRTDELIQELRNDIRDERDLRIKAEELWRGEIVKRERQGQEIESHRAEIAVLTRTTDDLLTWKEKAQNDLDAKTQRIEHLERDNGHLREDNIKLAAENHTLKIEGRAYRGALALVGEKVQEAVDARAAQEDHEKHVGERTA